MEVVKPDILHSRKEVDFGKGFYTTPLLEQARKWGDKFKKKTGQSVINKYTFNEAALEIYKLLHFDSYSENWLDFIVTCRNGEDRSDYDIVVGGVANDKVFNTVELYTDNLIDKAEALKRLKYERPNMQIAFRSQEVLDGFLAFEGSYEL